MVCCKACGFRNSVTPDAFQKFIPYEQVSAYIDNIILSTCLFYITFNVYYTLQHTLLVSDSRTLTAAGRMPARVTLDFCGCEILLEENVCNWFVEKQKKYIARVHLPRCCGITSELILFVYFIKTQSSKISRVKDEEDHNGVQHSKLKGYLRFQNILFVVWQQNIQNKDMSPLKTEFILYTIRKSVSYLTGNTLNLL
jgi:hypothetical protein